MKQMARSLLKFLSRHLPGFGCALGWVVAFDGQDRWQTLASFAVFMVALKYQVRAWEMEE